MPSQILERVPAWLAGGVVALMVALVLIAALSAADDRDRRIARHEEAQASWLSDCAAMGRTIDDCTFAWFKNPMLRDVYVAKP